MPQIDPDEVRSFYNLLPRIYDPADLWHQSTRAWIRGFLQDHHSIVSLSESGRVLNAGSGGEDCTFPEESTYHLDLSERRLPDNPRSVVGDLHSPPFEDEFFDIAVCVGSVINYCDAAVVIASLNRVLKQSGFLFLEFECTSSFDYLLKPGFSRSTALVTTFYNNQKVRLWAYGEPYVRAMLKANGFNAIAHSRAHILSPLVYRLTNSVNWSAKFAMYDKFVRRIPVLSRHCSNVIFLCEKI